MKSFYANNSFNGQSHAHCFLFIRTVFIDTALCFGLIGLAFLAVCLFGLWAEFSGY